MNLVEQLDRVTAPPPKASRVRRLSREEIAQLSEHGMITPLDRIPQQHLCGKETVGLRWGRCGRVFDGKLKWR